MNQDFGMALIASLGIVVLLGLPDVFWAVFKVFIIVMFSLLAVWGLGELTTAAPLVVVSFLGGAAVTGLVFVVGRVK